jgi:putative flippase GtrA
MPSGDAIQSALFVTFLYYLGLPVEYLFLFHLAVCLGRVYYMCHWVADTMVASVLGYFLGKVLNWVM